MVPAGDDRARVRCRTTNSRLARWKVAVDHVRVPRDDAVDARLGRCARGGLRNQGRGRDQECGRGSAADRHRKDSLSDAFHLITTNNREKQAISRIALAQTANAGIAVRGTCRRRALSLGSDREAGAGRPHKQPPAQYASWAERNCAGGNSRQYSIASISGPGSSISAQNRSRIFTVIGPGSPLPIGSPSSELIGVTPPAVVTAISSSAS